MIKFIRLDDRLIHGQVATNWIREVDPEFVLEVDDRVAGNQLLESLQRTSCPKDMALKICSSSQASALIKKYQDKQFFLLVGSVKALYNIAGDTPEIKSVDLGNMGYRDGKVKLINRLFVTAEEKALLKELQQKGVELYAQMIPQEPKDPIDPALLQ
jgi:mannose/fructose/N-acetylgalactosamine-specific phosphotransferase system component IIB